MRGHDRGRGRVRGPRRRGRRRCRDADRVVVGTGVNSSAHALWSRRGHARHGDHCMPGRERAPR